MEFHEKMQTLRKQKCLTQEELAQCLYVSRTAVSKWESGRGYPAIDTLQRIAAFFSVTVDSLLSGDTLVSTSPEEHMPAAVQRRIRIFGLLDIGTLLFLVLPLFGQNCGSAVKAVSLFALTGCASYVRVSYFAAVLGMAASGILLLALPNRTVSARNNSKLLLSAVCNTVSTLLFILSSQPYAASCLLLFLVIKGFLLFQKP